MKVLYESLKRNLSNPLFYFISIGAGFAFTLIFALFKPVRAVEISVIVFFSVIFFSFLVAFILKNKQDVIEAAKLYESKGNHVLALKILMSAREKAHDEVDCLRLDYEIGSIYYSMKQYQQSVNIILETLKGDETEWTWKAYFLLAKALSYTKGFLSDEALDAYLHCIDCRKKFDAYGKADLNVDIDLCQRISEIYIAIDNLAASNMWFRDEMILREAGCDIGTKNKITDLQEKAAVLACENHTEDALRLYEEAAHLIGQHISIRCDKYAVVQLEMGRLFWKGFVVPRYDLALACFQKSVEIKRKYMSDISEELSASFACALPDMREVCKKSLDDNTELYNEFYTKTCSLHEEDMSDIRLLRDRVIDKCKQVLVLFEEAFPEDALELAEIYRLIGESYKWFSLNIDDCIFAAIYLEKATRVLRKYKNDNSIQTKLSILLVDLGGTYYMQKDYETALSYRLEALRIISNLEDADARIIAGIEVSLRATYERTAQSKTVEYNSFLENNGLYSILR